ncbi:uncharacterized protein LACBIDRAFT_315002 [Laccaria bicolor S238N-H82]|uniref:Predicted protein n=1 Tax=Laccaria bicolor (strain S238N-H82 / ATCC MYA-4686) TaxID=486041 RepID=B0DZJ2_LACBS|nr:uncharacterized protein LACBIDRAFT_315002 [Laccaria bicolor S238N-H82]EDQ99950.1 predicted protein [Laccaria bicolor S238N-H82]|eukprot:XP_001889361.1 predicted protein [Laccaria bicolor S238N-H82]
MPKMKAFKFVVSTCISTSIVSGIGMARGHFTHIFIDEAGQAMEPEAFVSIKMMVDNDTNVVLSGDPKQLGPIIRWGVARELGLEVTYLERLMGREVYSVEGGKCQWENVSVMRLESWKRLTLLKGCETGEELRPSLPRDYREY